MSTLKPLVSLVIPFYNEEPSLIKLLPLVKDNLERTNVTYEVLLIDDASIDNSASVVEKFIISPTSDTSCFNLSIYKFSYSIKSTNEVGELDLLKMD